MFLMFKMFWTMFICLLCLKCQKKFQHIDIKLRKMSVKNIIKEKQINWHYC